MQALELTATTAENRLTRNSLLPPLPETPRLRYREFFPPEHLSGHVVCFWHRPGYAPANCAQILPDGCIDVIWAGELPPFVAGPMTVPLMPAMDAGTEIIGVRFRPGIAPSLLGISAHELLNQHVPLGDIWPRGRVHSWSDATDRDHFPAKYEAIVGAIVDRLGAVEQPDVFVADAARWIAARPTGNLAHLAHLSGLSERQMRRRFDEAIGYGPKKLQRILRLQRLLWLAGNGHSGNLNLAELALDAGYADQPHMTRDVAALGGASPSILLRGSIRSAVSDLFKTPAR